MARYNGLCGNSHGAARSTVLALDYDGTLTPVRVDSALAVLDSGVLERIDRVLSADLIRDV